MRLRKKGWLSWVFMLPREWSLVHSYPGRTLPGPNIPPALKYALCLRSYVVLPCFLVVIPTHYRNGILPLSKTRDPLAPIGGKKIKKEYVYQNNTGTRHPLPVPFDRIYC